MAMCYHRTSCDRLVGPYFATPNLTMECLHALHQLCSHTIPAIYHRLQYIITWESKLMPSLCHSFMNYHCNLMVMLLHFEYGLMLKRKWHSLIRELLESIYLVHQQGDSGPRCSHYMHRKCSAARMMSVDSLIFALDISVATLLLVLFHIGYGWVV